MSDEQFLAWVDLETTGLDYMSDHLLEIAVVVTDMNLNVAADAFWMGVLPLGFQTVSSVINYIKNNNPVVAEMHEKSGLLEKMVENPSDFHPIYDVEFELLNFFGRIAGGRNKMFLTAGSGVASFDVLWMRHLFPNVMEPHFGYQSVDIGQMRRFLDLVCKRPDLIPSNNVPHRALDDVHLFIEQARTFRDIFGKVLPVAD